MTRYTVGIDLGTTNCALSSRDLTDGSGDVILEHGFPNTRDCQRGHRSGPARLAGIETSRRSSATRFGIRRENGSPIVGSSVHALDYSL